MHYQRIFTKILNESDCFHFLVFLINFAAFVSQKSPFIALVVNNLQVRFIHPYGNLQKHLMHIGEFAFVKGVMPWTNLCAGESVLGRQFQIWNH